MRSDLIPPNRMLTIALIVGIFALIAYGVYAHDPATIVIIAALVIFFALPAALVYTFSRRARLRPPSPPDDAADQD